MRYLFVFLMVLCFPVSARGASLSGVVAAPLVDKVNEIIRDCHSRVISARASRRNRSNHPIGRAVDVQGNPSCIYAHLIGWPGGYSIDYYTAPNGKHVHISYNPGGQEWGARFIHRHGSKRHVLHRSYHTGRWKAHHDRRASRVFDLREMQLGNHQVRSGG